MWYPGEGILLCLQNHVISCLHQSHLDSGVPSPRLSRGKGRVGIPFTVEGTSHRRTSVPSEASLGLSIPFDSKVLPLTERVSVVTLGQRGSREVTLPVSD